MAFFRCENPNCTAYNKDIEKTGTLRLHWNEERSKYVSYFKCDVCGKYLAGYRNDPVNLEQVTSINKGATKVSSDKRNTIY
jgi:hypothetical protein